MSDLLKIDREKAEKFYNKAYRDKLQKYYNNLLGYFGVIDVKVVVVERSTINCDVSKLQPKQFSVDKKTVKKIKHLYEMNDYKYACEPQLITNQSEWDDSVDEEWQRKDELIAGFKRNEAQKLLKKDGLAFQHSDVMVYIKLYFKDRKAYHSVKTLSNATRPEQSPPDPNSHVDIVLCLEDMIKDGALADDIHQHDNQDILMEEIVKLTPDKSDRFRTKVRNIFWTKEQKDKKYFIIYDGNIDEVVENRKLPKSGGHYQPRDSYVYHSNNGEMKTTWENMKKNFNTFGKEIDVVMYIGSIKKDIIEARLDEVKRLIKSYKIQNNFVKHLAHGKCDDVNSIFRFIGFHYQAKCGLAHLGGIREETVANKTGFNILRHPYEWFHVSNKEEMKLFLRKHLTEDEFKSYHGNADLARIQVKMKAGNYHLEEQQYKDIMDVYENSLIKEVEEHSINGEPLEEYQRSA